MRHSYLSRADGSTLIELIVVIVVITILAVVSIPTFLSYRDKSRVSAVMASSDAIRSALAGYASSQRTTSYPAAIDDYDSLVTLVNQNGGQLDSASIKSGFTLQGYTPLDHEGDGEYESYTMTVRVNNVPDKKPGWCVVITPGAITKCNPV